MVLLSWTLGSLQVHAYPIRQQHSQLALTTPEAQTHRFYQYILSKSWKYAILHVLMNNRAQNTIQSPTKSPNLAPR
jgi:hypothetical protein